MKFERVCLDMRADRRVAPPYPLQDFKALYKCCIIIIIIIRQTYRQTNRQRNRHTANKQSRPSQYFAPTGAK